MSSPVTFDALLQAIASLLIFIAWYLALFLSIVICLVLAEFVYEGADLVRTYLARPGSLENRFPCGPEDIPQLASRRRRSDSPSLKTAS
jgi:hypothetical protein